MMEINLKPLEQVCSDCAQHIVIVRRNGGGTELNCKMRIGGEDFSRESSKSS